MQGNREHFPFTARAEADLLANRFVKEGVAAKGMVYAGAGEKCMGVLKFDTVNGDVGTVHQDGDVKLQVSEAVALNDEISAAANGKGQVAAAGEHVLGKALQAALADGDVIEFRIYRGKYIKP